RQAPERLFRKPDVVEFRDAQKIVLEPPDRFTFDRHGATWEVHAYKRFVRDEPVQLPEGFLAFLHAERGHGRVQQLAISWHLHLCGISQSIGGKQRFIILAGIGGWPRRADKHVTLPFHHERLHGLRWRHRRELRPEAYVLELGND